MLWRRVIKEFNKKEKLVYALLRFKMQIEMLNNYKEKIIYGKVTTMFKCTHNITLLTERKDNLLYDLIFICKLKESNFSYVLKNQTSIL